MPRNRRPAYDRLIELPAVFALPTAMRRLGLDMPSTRVTLSRWCKRGYIQAAGPRAGVYYNLVADRESPSERLCDAIMMLYPSAVLSEASVLHASGWTTQVPRRLSVNVIRRPSCTRLYGVDLRPRGIEWFKLMHREHAIVSHEDAGFPTYGLRSLKPEWALADMMSDPDAWHPDEDDLDVSADGIRDARNAGDLLAKAI